MSDQHSLSLSKYHNACGALEDPPAGCAYPYRPDVELPPDAPGKSARIGTGVHRLSHACVARTIDTLYDMDPTEAAEARAIYNGPLKAYVEAWRDEPADAAVSEVAMRWDMRTDRVRIVARRGQPEYERSLMHEMGGEVDLMRKIGDLVEVEDIKTGSPKHVHEEQLLGYGVLASRHFGVTKVRVRFLYALKTKLTPTPWVEMDADRLDAEAGRIAKVLRRLPMAQPVVGEWCEGWRCPLGKARCPLYAEGEMQERIAAGVL